MKLRKLAIAGLFTTAACSPMLSRQPPAVDKSLFLPGETSLVPATDKLNPNCSTRPEFDACIYAKNPVAQKGASVTEGELNGLLTYGVKLRNLSPTGNLENSRVQVLTLNTPRMTIFDSAKFKSVYSASESYVEQMMAYYWADRVMEYLEARLGSARLPVLNLKIYVDDAFTGFSSRKFSISLEKSDSEIAKALSAEAIVQLTGQAIAHKLSGERIFAPENSAQHKSCGMANKGCCSASVGCANALAGAVGDYLIGVMFPNQAQVGETIANSVSGQTISGFARDLESLSAQSQSGIFTASGGHIAIEGAWYASLWWKIRTQADSTQAIDILFFDHVRELSSNSTFIDAKQAAVNLAASYQSGKYLSLVQSVLAAIR